MKQLLLVRHAKSSWADPLQKDFDRPLNHRGELAAKQVGKWLASAQLLPDQVILSAARRCQQTWECASEDLSGVTADPPQEDLYGTNRSGLVSAIRSARPEADRLLVLNHEPTISQVTEWLAEPGAALDCTRAFQKFPTAAVAVLEFPTGSWVDIARGTGRFTRFICPKDLI